MNTKTKMVLGAAAIMAAASGPALAAESSMRDAVRHPIRTMKEKMHMNRADTGRSEQSGRSGRTSEMPGYGSSGPGASGGMSDNSQYAADRERTRERARAYVESGGRSGSSSMRQGGSGR